MARRLLWGMAREPGWDNRNVHYAGELALTKVEDLTYEVGRFLEDHDFPSLITPSAYSRSHQVEIAGKVLSLPHLAVEAGLGTLGLNLQLLTPEFGPRVILGRHRDAGGARAGPAAGARALPGRGLRALSPGLPRRRHRPLRARPRRAARRTPRPTATTSSSSTWSASWTTPDPAQRMERVQSMDTFMIWQSMLRGVGVYTGCTRCADVCPVGADYEAHLREVQAEIPEATPAKDDRLRGLQRAAGPRGGAGAARPRPLDRRPARPDVTTTRADVCVVGGGPAGLLLGLLLARRGVEVVVLEGHETFDREFRGEVLQPSTLHLLDELGLLEYVRAQPHSLLTAGKVRVDGKPAGEFSFRRIAPEYPHAIWMPQPIFLQALLDKARPFPSFQGWMGARASELVLERGVVVGVRGRRHGKEPFEVRADVVVAADGRYSPMRRLGDFEVEYEHHDFDVIWFVIEQPPGWPSTIYISLGRDAPGAAPAEVPAPHPGRPHRAHRRMAALARRGRGGGRRPDPPLRPGAVRRLRRRRSATSPRSSRWRA